MRETEVALIGLVIVLGFVLYRLFRPVRSISRREHERWDREYREKFGKR